MYKKLLFTLFCVTVILTGCSSTSFSHTPDDCPEVFSSGQQDALEKIRYSARIDSMAWDNGYVKVEDLLFVLERRYGEKAAYEIRDLMDLYTSSEILEDLIDDYKWE